jgi:hypothetical protein
VLYHAIPGRWLKILARISTVAIFAILATVLFRGVHISAQDFPAPIGRIEGDDLEVATTTPSGVETDAAPTVVASGSDVTVRSGHALIMLNAGGEISVCGPAHFKLIKSSGALTLALDYGRVHPSLDSAESFTIYTPTIVATPIAISGGRRDMTLGLQQNGEMCVLTARGAMRVEPQFAEQSVIIPQGGDVSLVGGQIQSLHADASACSCDFPRAGLSRPKSNTPAQTPPSQSLGALSRPVPPERKKTEDPTPPPASGGGAVYTVLMPPLTFNANSPEPPPEPDAETILLVREVRLRPAAVYRGHVNPAPAQATARPVLPPAPAPSDDQPLPTQPSFLDRVRSFFRKLASANRTPCARAGCSG